MSRIFVLEDREVIENQITVEGKLSQYEPFTKEDIFISNRICVCNTYLLEPSNICMTNKNKSFQIPVCLLDNRLQHLID